MDTKSIISKNLQDSIHLKKTILKNDTIVNQIVEISHLIVNTFENKHQLLLCGNGGSAADSQHLAAEFSGRYYLNRAPLKAMALHTDTSFLTAVSNDYSFDEVYSRLVEAIGTKGDILLGLSTSGNSKNIVNALRQAKQQHMITVGFTGKNQSDMDDYCDYIIKVPSIDTPRIQEAHMIIGHSICEIVEQKLFS